MVLEKIMESFWMDGWMWLCGFYGFVWLLVALFSAKGGSRTR
jgi:hypothetical protein